MSESTTFFGGSAPALVPRENYIINGGFQVRQRADSYSNTTGEGYYTADRWYLFPNNIDNSIGGDAGVPHMKIKRLASATAFQVRQGLESVSTANGNSRFQQGDILTLSYEIYPVGVSGCKAKRQVSFADDVANLTNAQTLYNVNTDPLPADQWTKVTATFEIGVQAATDQVLAVTIGGVFDVAQAIGTEVRIRKVKLEKGESPTPFEMPDFASEFLQCQRYYQKSYEYGTPPGALTSAGSSRFRLQNMGTGANRLYEPFSIGHMRISPTITLYSPVTGATGFTRDFNASADVAAVASQIGNNSFVVTHGAMATGSIIYVGTQWTADAEL